jgi:insulysin
MKSSISDTSFACYLTITIELTEDGFENMWEIVPIIFSYTKMLIKEGVQKWIYEELRDLSEIGFKYEDKDEGTSVVTYTSTNLQYDYIPREYLLKSPYLYDQYNPDMILDLLENYITPNSLRIFVFSQKYQDSANLTEEWYQTKYSLENFSESFLNDLNNPPEWKNLDPPLYLPVKKKIFIFHLFFQKKNKKKNKKEKNIYIPKNFDLKPFEEFSSLYPCSLIRDDTHCKVWYKRDCTFKQPKGAFEIMFESPIGYSSPRDTVRAFIYLFIFNIFFIKIKTLLFTEILADHLKKVRLFIFLKKK